MPRAPNRQAHSRSDVPCGAVLAACFAVGWCRTAKPATLPVLSSSEAMRAATPSATSTSSSAGPEKGSVVEVPRRSRRARRRRIRIGLLTPQILEELLNRDDSRVGGIDDRPSPLSLALGSRRQRHRAARVGRRSRTPADVDGRSPHDSWRVGNLRRVRTRADRSGSSALGARLYLRNMARKRRGRKRLSLGSVLRVRDSEVGGGPLMEMWSGR